jgi:hypothetical protein
MTARPWQRAPSTDVDLPISLKLPIWKFAVTAPDKVRSPAQYEEIWLAHQPRRANS